MMLRDICKIINNNNDIINKKYSDITFEVNCEDIPERGIYHLNLYIYTNYKRLPSEKHLEKIKNLFNAVDAMFIDCDPTEGDPNFWSVTLERRGEELF